MATKQPPRAGDNPPAHAHTMPEDVEPMSPSLQQHTQATRTEGVTVVGEAVRRVPPDTLELLIEITAGVITAAQAVRDNQARTAQVTQAVTTLGVQAGDLQPISQNIYNLYSPVMGGAPLLPAYGQAQMGQVGFP